MLFAWRGHATPHSSFASPGSDVGQFCLEEARESLEGRGKSSVGCVVIVLLHRVCLGVPRGFYAGPLRVQEAVYNICLRARPLEARGHARSLWRNVQGRFHQTSRVPNASAKADLRGAVLHLLLGKQNRSRAKQAAFLSLVKEGLKQESFEEVRKEA